MDTLSIIDDDINELEQSFVLLAELGPEVPSDAACFRHSESTDQCNGRIGAVEIRIRDNDRMYSGSHVSLRRLVSVTAYCYGAVVS